MLQVRWNIGKPIKQKDKKRRAAVFDPIANKLASHRDFDLHAEEIVITAGKMAKIATEPPKPAPPAKAPTITNPTPKKLDVPKVALELLMPEMAKRNASYASHATTSCASSETASFGAGDEIDLLSEIDLHDIAHENFEADLLGPSAAANPQFEPFATRDALADFVSDGSTIAVEDVLEAALADFPAPVSTPVDASQKGVAALAMGLTDVLGLSDMKPMGVTEAEMLGMAKDFKMPTLPDGGFL